MTTTTTTNTNTTVASSEDRLLAINEVLVEPLIESFTAGGGNRDNNYSVTLGGGNDDNNEDNNGDTNDSNTNTNNSDDDDDARRVLVDVDTTIVLGGLAASVRMVLSDLLLENLNTVKAPTKLLEPVALGATDSMQSHLHSQHHLDNVLTMGLGPETKRSVRLSARIYFAVEQLRAQQVRSQTSNNNNNDNNNDRQRKDHNSLPRRLPPPLPRWCLHCIRAETRIPSIPPLPDDAEPQTSRHHCQARLGIQGTHHGIPSGEWTRSRVLSTADDALSHRQHGSGRNQKGCRTEKLRWDTDHHRLQVLPGGCHDKFRLWCLGRQKYTPGSGSNARGRDDALYSFRGHQRRYFRTGTRLYRRNHEAVGPGLSDSKNDHGAH
mmetsp:Transcript_24809/g.52638  ORF Transcript_24809/g.52638 Transcript_24809/m.52638 type:complete len:378 (+) Transcript_24809:654-1787(+)